jgi:hypothetical protein
MWNKSLEMDNMDGVATTGSELLIRAGTPGVQEFRPRSQDFWCTKVANPYMGLQIHALRKTRKVQERGKKNRAKSQGTLEGRVSHGGCTLE